MIKELKFSSREEAIQDPLALSLYEAVGESARDSCLNPVPL